ncbi:MAG: hypothetical protein U0411_09845 [Thermodesulfovibrionales bacterium]
MEDSDVLVTPDTWRVIDPEFDNVYFRALWQSTSNNLWISKLDEDGKFTVGETYQLASGLAPINADNANGPEWVYSSSGVVSIIYTVPDATYGYRLKVAKEVNAGGAANADGWTLYYVPNAEGGRCALSEPTRRNTGPSRILYQKLTDGVVKVYWRNLYYNEQGVETELSAEASQAHFSFDGTQIALAQVLNPNDPLCSESIVRNPMIYDIGTKQDVRKTNSNKGRFPWILDLDEDGDKETMLFTLETEHRTPKCTKNKRMGLGCA